MNSDLCSTRDTSWIFNHSKPHYMRTLLLYFVTAEKVAKDSNAGSVKESAFDQVCHD